MSHYAWTSGTSRVFTVASLQRLKLEALIPVPADCEVRSVIKFLNVQSITPIEIHVSYARSMVLTSRVGTLKVRDSRNREKFKNSRKVRETCF